jgi:integrase
VIYKRGQVWWTRFTVNGERYQQSLETPNKRAAIDAEQKKITAAARGELSSKVTDFGKLNFEDALKLWLTKRHQVISERTGAKLAAKTVQTEWEMSVPLIRLLGAQRVSKFTATLVTNYLNKRHETVSPATCNRELDLIRGLLKSAKLWARMADSVKVFKMGEPIGKAFTEDERAKILAVAGSKPEWRNDRLAFIICVNTTCRPIELKSLEWRDVDLGRKVITLRRSKTDAGKRVIPLNSPALEAVQECARDAKLLSGGFLPADWYVLPGKSPTGPLTSWRTAWRKILRAAGVNCTRFYNTRHTAITDLLQNPNASEETVKSIAGHVDKRILERYSHSRIEAKRKALDSMADNFSGKSAGTVLVHSGGSGPNAGA